jgi:hypothetical protein
MEHPLYKSVRAGLKTSSDSELADYYALRMQRLRYTLVNLRAVQDEINERENPEPSLALRARHKRYEILLWKYLKTISGQPLNDLAK